MHLPKSLRNWSPTLFTGLSVSIATGMNVYVCASCMYFAVFLSDAVSAAVLLQLTNLTETTK